MAAMARQVQAEGSPWITTETLGAWQEGTAAEGDGAGVTEPERG
jgi:hypothetical protein